MTRTMGDAIGANAGALAAAAVDMYAVYVTGTGAVPWTMLDRAHLIAGRPVVTIDQGAAGSPVPSAHVRDVEAGAWTVAAAVNRAWWTAPRPTVYCSASVLPALAAAGWRGDVWVADYINQAPTAPFPVPAGMTCVAWQWTDTGGGGAYDLSVVFDPYWPSLPPQQEDDMIIVRKASDGSCALLRGDTSQYIAEGSDLAALTGDGGLKVATISDALYTALTATPPPLTAVTAQTTLPTGTITWA